VGVVIEKATQEKMKGDRERKKGVGVVGKKWKANLNGKREIRIELSSQRR
jgi:hypothetical protein